MEIIIDPARNGFLMEVIDDDGDVDVSVAYNAVEVREMARLELNAYLNKVAPLPGIPARGRPPLILTPEMRADVAPRKKRPAIDRIGEALRNGRFPI